MNMNMMTWMGGGARSFRPPRVQNESRSLTASAASRRREVVLQDLHRREAALCWMVVSQSGSGYLWTVGLEKRNPDRNTSHPAYFCNRFHGLLLTIVVPTPNGARALHGGGGALSRRCAIGKGAWICRWTGSPTPGAAAGLGGCAVGWARAATRRARR